MDVRKLEFRVENTRLDPQRTRAAALDLTGKGAQVMWVTCDVDWATPSTQVGISKGLLPVSPCIGTDQMGPQALRQQGRARVLLREPRPGRGRRPRRDGQAERLQDRAVVADKSVVYTQNVCQAFANRFKQNGGKVVHQETFTEGDGTINRVVSRVNGVKADTMVMCATTQKDLPTFASGVRSAGDQTPIIGPWSIDGSFWLPKDPKLANNIWVVTYASIYGDDPSPQVRRLIQQLQAKGASPATSGFVTGAATVDGIVAAIKQNEGRPTEPSSRRPCRNSRTCRRSPAGSPSRASTTARSGGRTGSSGSATASRSSSA